jgi:histone H3/H4
MTRSKNVARKRTGGKAVEFASQSQSHSSSNNNNQRPRPPEYVAAKKTITFNRASPPSTPRRGYRFSPSVSGEIRAVPKRQQKGKYPRFKINQEIRRYSTLFHGPLVPFRPFARAVREICETNLGKLMRWNETAIDALREAAENYLTQLMSDAYLAAIHGTIFSSSTLLPFFHLNFLA